MTLPACLNGHRGRAVSYLTPPAQTCTELVAERSTELTPKAHDEVRLPLVFGLPAGSRRARPVAWFGGLRLRQRLLKSSLPVLKRSQLLLEVRYLLLDPA